MVISVEIVAGRGKESLSSGTEKSFFFAANQSFDEYT